MALSILQGCPLQCGRGGSELRIKERAMRVLLQIALGGLLATGAMAQGRGGGVRGGSGFGGFGRGFSGAGYWPYYYASWGYG